MRWAQFGAPKVGVYHIAKTWKSDVSQEWRYEPACHGLCKEYRDLGDSDLYCTQCLLLFCETLGEVKD